MRGKGDLLRKGRNVEKWGGWRVVGARGMSPTYWAHMWGNKTYRASSEESASPAAQLLEESRNANMTRL